MIIKYKIQDQINSILIKKNIGTVVPKYLDKINSDKKILFIFDQNVSKGLLDSIFFSLKLNGFKIYKMKLDGFKHNKNEKYLFKLIDFLIEKKFSKNSILLSCGGGVIGDLSALASSLYLRGLNYCHIPTTLTAIVDSCIGGKTGINYKDIINSVGNYYHPKIVFIFDEIIKKMPNREFLSGIPEILKCGVIKKNKILKILLNSKSKIINRDFKVISNLCKETLKTKIHFFINDVREKKSRLNLNFGHTFAHSIEMSCNFNKNNDFLRHGEAVGLGMLCEVYYSNKKVNKMYLLIKKLLDEYSLFTTLNALPKAIDKMKLHKKIVQNVFLDKKKINMYPRYISLKKFYKPMIKEIDNMNLLNETIYKIIK